jgi:hypothetical protein
MACSFHNHAVEFQTRDGVRLIDILGASKDLLFHIDVNVCRQTGTTWWNLSSNSGKPSACCH